jgi:HEPN domain-containing protein
MSPPRRANELLALARRDLKAASILTLADEPQADTAGFHLQQAAEKGLKAWLEWCGVTYPKTHDLSLLLGLLDDAEQDIQTYWSLLDLNPFAVQFRYEITEEEPFGHSRSAALVDQLIQHVQTLIETR